MKNLLATLWELLHSIPAAIWTLVVGGLIGWISKRKQVSVEIDGKILETRIKKERYDNERYEQILNELIEYETKLDARDKIIEQMRLENEQYRNLIKELRAEINILLTVRRTGL